MLYGSLIVSSQKSWDNLLLTFTTAEGVLEAILG